MNNLFDIYFNSLYCLVFFINILILFVSLRFKNVYGIVSIALFLFLIAYILVIGFRDYSIGSDTEGYASNFVDLEEMLGGKDPGFLYLSKFLHFFGGIRFTIVSYSFLYFYLLFKAIKLFSIDEDKFLWFFVFISFFFFKSMTINVIRQGLSLIFSLIALGYLLKEKKTYFVIYLLLSVSFHISSLLFIFSILLAVFVKNINYLIILFLISIVISFYGLGFNTLAIYSGYGEVLDKANELTELFDYGVGFKLSFVLFNSFFLFCFLFKRKKSVFDKSDEMLLKLYLINSSIFFLYFYFPYSDRVGMLSWIFLIPLIYNLFLKHQSNLIKTVFSFCLFSFYWIQQILV